MSVQDAAVSASNTTQGGTDTESSHQPYFAVRGSLLALRMAHHRSTSNTAHACWGHCRHGRAHRDVPRRYNKNTDASSRASGHAGLITLRVSTAAVPHAAPPQLHGSTIRRAMRVIVKHEGVAGLYRGVGAVLAGTGYMQIRSVVVLPSPAARYQHEHHMLHIVSITITCTHQQQHLRHMVTMFIINNNIKPPHPTGQRMRSTLVPTRQSRKLWAVTTQGTSHSRQRRQGQWPPWRAMRSTCHWMWSNSGCRWVLGTLGHNTYVWQ